MNCRRIPYALIALIVLILLFAGALPCEAQEVSLEFSLTLEEVAAPVEEATAWLFQVAWGHLDRTPFPQDERGRIRIELSRERLHEEILTHPVPEYFVLVLEVPGQGWYRTRDMAADRFLEVLQDELRTLGSLVWDGNGNEVLVLPRLPERVVRVIDGNGRRMAGFDVPLTLFLTSRNHCGGLNGIPLGRFTTDERGEIALRAPWADLAAQVMYLLKEREGWSVNEGMLLGPKPLEIIQIVEFPVREFRVRVVDEEGAPVEGVWVGSCLRLNECGAGCGNPWMTDADGVAVVEFVPETSSRMFLATQDAEIQDLSGEEVARMVGTGEVTVVVSGSDESD